MYYCFLKNLMVALCLSGFLCSTTGWAQEKNPSKAVLTFKSTKGGDLQVVHEDGSVEKIKPRPFLKLKPRKFAPKKNLNSSAKPTNVKTPPILKPITDKDIKTMLRNRPNRNIHRMSTHRPPPKPRNE